jgi:phosphatidylglycerol:prolipoprotein diacylglycerol transferase
MLTYPAIDPVLIKLGPLAIHWYGVMYLIGFSLAWWLGLRRADSANIKPVEMGDIIFYCALGVVIGGRLGYILFYNLADYSAHPLAIFKVWEGGMAFHGGLLGVLIAVWLYARKSGHRFFALTDFIAPLIPLGLAAGRLGNFINGELWGRPTDLPWGMIFPNADDIARHPSQLYQAALEGVALFAILWWFSKKPRPMMAVSGLFLIGYSCFRFFAEFFRTPDAHLGFLAFDWLTMGQLLSVPMFVAGIVLMTLAYRFHTVDQLQEKS